MDRKITVAGLDDVDAATTAELLSGRLAALIDLQLTLKHVHWNVVGPNFIGVHEMLDPQVDAVREMTDTVAERIATMGGEPHGTPGAVIKVRTWEDYPLGRDLVANHLAELVKVYDGVISDHRAARAQLEDLDAVSEDMVIGQLRELELFQWFVEAHLADKSGKLDT